MSQRGRIILAATGGLVAAVVMAGCGTTPDAGAPSPTPPSASAATTPATPSQSGSPSPAQSISRDAYTARYAAGVLKEYLGALVSKNAAAICALDARTAPANPKRISQQDCVRLMEGRITGEDWTNLEVDCWASAKDRAACAGMDPVAAKAKPNEEGNFVFDSTRQGFRYTAGIPEGCDPKNTTGCWFVVVYDSDGHVSVMPHWGERVYR